ncbi:cobyrinate a,c-diamide synthase [Neomoorella mulderi]|uniref:cobyrinate a,c-diamide synthase n=1 Tax=Neomoorella mulderi TaxID=202604 RepID=UPI0007866393
MRLVIAAPHGRSGKTTITLGLIVALRQRGLVIQPFKKGPDFIDPSWLTLAAGRPCRNLDLYFLPPEKLEQHFSAGCRGADLGLIEGAMGLFDGLDLEGSNSTAAIACTLKCPVVLVIDAVRMTRSAAAMVQGFQNFDPRVRIAGVILNQVARPRHEDMLRRSIEHYTGLPVLGALPKKRDFVIPDRHLGLIPAAENESIHAALAATGAAIAANVDLDAMLAIASQVPALPPGPEWQQPPLPQVRLGIFQDRAFTFYYPENLEALEQAGAQVITIDSLQDEKLPAIDGLYIGGGFPEVFAGQLEANVSLRKAVKRAVAEGMPVYAECGGLMYLARRLNYQGRWYEMSGSLPLDVTMSSRPQGHGYTTMLVEGESPFLARGSIIKGHEFHHSRVINLDRQAVGFLYRVQRGFGIDGRVDGILYNRVLAGYNHLYAPTHPEWAANLVGLAAGKRKIKTATL